MEKLLIFLSGSSITLVIREALSGFINEWIKDYFAEKKRKRMVKYDLGEKILSIITADMSDLTKKPPIDRIIKVKQHVYGFSKNISKQLLFYGKIRKLLHKEFIRILGKKPVSVTVDDIKMMERFSDEVSIMHEGLTVGAHKLMGNKTPKFLFLRLKYMFRRGRLLQEIKNATNNTTLYDLIKKSNQD